MPNSTVYDVQVRYGLDDKASAALENLGRTAERTEKHVGGLKEGLRTLAEVFLVKEGLTKAKEWFVDANAEMEQMKINLAAVSSYNLGKPFAEAAASTDKLIAGWQQFSKSTTLTTKQFVEFGAMIEGPVLNATGGNMKIFDDITKRGAVVGQILGAAHPGGSAYVAREFQEALSGNVRNTQMLNKMLLEPALEKAGKTIKDWNTMTSQDRVKIFMSAINDPAWDAAIDKQRNSFLGVTSTLRDNFEILARETGEKFFEKIKGGVAEINKFIDTHPKEIAEFTTKVSDGLAKAFDFMKNTFEFIVRHKDLLLKLGEVWAIGKITGAFGGANGMLGMLGGSAANISGQGMIGGFGAYSQNFGDLFKQRGQLFAGSQAGALYSNGGQTLTNMRIGALVGAGLDSLTGNLGATNTALMTFEGVVAGLPGPLGLVGQGLLALHATLKWFADKFDERHKVAAESSGDFGAFQNYLKKNDAGALYAMLKQEKIVQNGEFNRSAMTAWLDLKRRQGNIAGIYGGDFDGGDARGNVKIAAQAAALVARMKDRAFRDNFYQQQEDKPTGVDAGKKKDAANVNVTIHKIEVPASDPDRFVHSLVKKFDKVAKNPTQADRALRGGF